MKCLFVSAARYPYPTGNGVAVLMHALITCYQRLGYEVTIVPTNAHFPEDEAPALTFWEQEGVTVKQFPELLKVKSHRSKIDLARRLMFPRMSDHFHINEVQTSGLADYVAAGNFDIVAGFDWEALGIIGALDHPKKIISLVDPMDAVLALEAKRHTFSLEPAKLRRWLKFKLACKKPAYGYRLLHKADIIFEHAWQHCEELREMGYANTHYFPHPLPKMEPMPPKTPDDTVTVLILGSLKGKASRVGFEFFLDKIMPRLEPKLAQLEKKVVFRVVGHGKPAPEIKARLEANAYCDLVGFVEELPPEFARADMMLVNIPIAHGFRTRIAEGFGYGKCVMAHAANALGMPEMRDGENSLTAEDPDIYVDKLLQAITDPELRDRLGSRARETFVEEVCLDAAVVKMASVLGLPN